MAHPYRTTETACATAPERWLDLEELLIVLPLWLLGLVDAVAACRTGSPHGLSAFVVSLGVAVALHRLLGHARRQRVTSSDHISTAQSTRPAMR